MIIKRVLSYILADMIAVAAVCTGAYDAVRPEDIKRDTADIAQYGEWYGLLGHTDLLIFPEEIPEGAEQAEYCYYNDANDLAPSSYVFLKCTYDEKTYADEKARLSSIEGMRTDTEHYPAAACVTLLEAHETEYALLSGENTIEYIFFCEGVHPRIPDSSYIRTVPPSSEELFSVYPSSGKDLRYWPDSWKH